MDHFKMSTSRDFRINPNSLKQVLENQAETSEEEEEEKEEKEEKEEGDGGETEDQGESEEVNKQVDICICHIYYSLFVHVRE